MNNILELKGKRFIQASKTPSNGGRSMNSKIIVTSQQVNRLIDKIRQIKKFWQNEKTFFNGVLISVYYNKIVAKSNRIAGLFKGRDSNYSIVGAKFNDDKNKHIITYFLKIKDLDRSIDLLLKANEVIIKDFPNGIDTNIFEDKGILNRELFNKYAIKKTVFKDVIADVSYIDDFDIDIVDKKLNQSIITLYNTNVDVQKLLEKIGINILSSRILDNQTVFLDENQTKILFAKAPYLVAMATEDLSNLSPDNFIKNYDKNILHMPIPMNEPTIGVIDTLFDSSVYFNEWVEYYDMIDENITKSPSDYRHGTAVTSIIVDGPRLNPWLDDGCGHFRVRHFGVAVGAKFSSFTIIKQIKEIIASNSDIKVWNLSLGSNQEINDNFISAEAAILDKIQYENDVIFVIAGTNKPNEMISKIGSPADSINSIVVNSVTRKGLSTKYSRRGLALSFFAKPDVSYYGGSAEEYIRVCEPLGEALVAGTSYAAPWIARKLSYLIDILGINRELAKALIIDAARGWEENPTPEKVALYGHGIVPIKIDDIIKTKDDEIKFLVSDVSEKWNTYNYHFPVPIKNDKYPYIVKATMCYFPMGDRAQGVDYTNTELNLHFGRINDKGNIIDVKGDKQNKDEMIDHEKYFLLEGEARKKFRKWDNVKYIAEVPKDNMKPKKSYLNKNWGIEVKTNNRLDPRDGIGIKFGIVVTLKEIDGVNRIDEFIRSCILNGWLVNKIDIGNRIEVNKKLHENIQLE